jgi:hypothetical protein
VKEFQMNLDGNTVVSVVLFIIFCILSSMWAKELIFYRRQNWNFEVNNGGRSIGFGLEGGEPDLPVSNKTRVVILYPLLLAIIFAFCFAFSNQ